MYGIFSVYYYFMLNAIQYIKHILYVIEFNSISHFMSMKNADTFVCNLNIKKKN